MSHPAPKVLHVTTTDISLELLIGPQLSAFAEAGYEVVTCSAPGPYVAAVNARGLRHIALEHSTRSMSIASDVRAMRELYQVIRTERPEIVHTHNPKPGVYGRIIARSASTPVVINTVHGLYAQPSDGWQRRAAVYGLERLAAAFSHAELVQNPEDVETLRRLGVPGDRLTLLGNGVDLDRFDPEKLAGRRREIRSRLGVGDTDVMVLAVGRLVVEKGYRELFEAVRLMPAGARAALKVVVAGPYQPDKEDGLSSAELKAAEASGIDYVGATSEVEELYGAADMYVLASHREGFPRSAMEAAAMGLPIVATDIRGCRQVVEDGQSGLLVSPHDPPALALGIARLVEDPDLRAAMAHRAREKAIAEFDQNQQIDRTLSTYERLLAEHRPAGARRGRDAQAINRSA